MTYVKLDMEKYIEGKPQPEGFFNALSHNQAYSGKIKPDEWLDKIQELVNYLTDGELPEGVECKSPKLSPSMAQNVLWFLQEITKIIPDNFAICDGCGVLHEEGYLKYFTTNGKYYCDYCLDSAPVVHCEECDEEAGYKKDAYSEKHEMYLCKECKKIKRETDIVKP